MYLVYRGTHTIPYSKALYTINEVCGIVVNHTDLLTAMDYNTDYTHFVRKFYV